MKSLIVSFLLLFGLVINTFSQTNPKSRAQKGYNKKGGTYVQQHNKTQPNRTNVDNYSTKPNVNPYTGKQGSRAQDYSPNASQYGKGKIIQKGKKGGNVYRNNYQKKSLCS
jgi:hypothetical protein